MLSISDNNHAGFNEAKSTVDDTLNINKLYFKQMVSKIIYPADLC